jgi:hypothetical protein
MNAPTLQDVCALNLTNPSLVCLTQSLLQHWFPFELHLSLFLCNRSQLDALKMLKLSWNGNPCKALLHGMARIQRIEGTAW